jgi:putative OPT family oligopeptide transporter
MQDRIPDSASLPELTLRGLALGAAITIIFTAANLYLALKVGIGIATSIPAAVISMGVLRFARGSNILENNIVQTVASSAGTLTAVVLSLPGLVLLGAWSGFPFWYTAGICAVGGVLGVTYTVPLRRALVIETALPFPEGVAAAEILRVGAAGNKEAGLRDVVLGAIVAAGFALAGAVKLFAESITVWLRVGGATTALSTSFSFALIGAGWLVGITVGLATLLGFVIAWGVAVPYLTLTVPLPADLTSSAHAMLLWRSQVRFLGVGCIAVAAVWTLLQLLRPMLRGISASMAALRQRRRGGPELPRTERDIPFNRIVQISLAMIIPLTALLSLFAATQPGFDDTAPPVLVFAAVLFVMLFGFLVAAACGYMAGLIGASNSPISGIGIVSTILVAVPLAALLGEVDGALRDAVVALIIFTVSVIVAVATISNDNLQDLKTGQLVGATPWKQQLALIVGVLVGALVIPPTLDLLYQAYGFATSLPRPDMDPRQALAAPQATLIATLTKGIVAASIDWTMIVIGAAIGCALILVDLLLQRFTPKGRLPVLAVGLGIYLPAASSAAIVLGAILSWLLGRALRNRPNREASLRRGVLLASGLIVGESLFGVTLAMLILGTGAQEPLALLPAGFEPTAEWLGGLAFLALAALLYRRGRQ